MGEFAKNVQKSPIKIFDLNFNIVLANHAHNQNT